MKISHPDLVRLTDAIVRLGLKSRNQALNLALADWLEKVEKSQRTSAQEQRARQLASSMQHVGALIKRPPERSERS